MAEARADNLLNDSPGNSDSIGVLSRHVPALAMLLMVPQPGAALVPISAGNAGQTKTLFITGC